MWDQETDGSPLTKGGFYRAASRDTADWHGLAVPILDAAFHTVPGKLSIRWRGLVLSRVYPAGRGRFETNRPPMNCSAARICPSSDVRGRVAA